MIIAALIISAIALGVAIYSLIQVSKIKDVQRTDFIEELRKVIKIEK